MEKIKNKTGKLFIVATPIGNLADITLRALETLKKVDLILCEDTRVTSILLRHYSIDKPMLTYNDHSDEYIRQKILDKLEQGHDLALVSDAGTPLISDPGYKLIQDLKQLNIKNITIPGPCSIIAALTLAGLPTDRFMFIGFLPHKTAGKEKIFTELGSIATSLICFESANRLLDTLALIDSYFSNRNIAVVREITKLYEETTSGSGLDIIKYYQAHPDKLRGEIVLLIGPPQENNANREDEIIANLTKLMKDMSLRDAVEIITSQYNSPKKQIYKLALKIRGE
jgi:16S rRNA (cytidine1402-2'-O)-methyltransferase